MAKMGKKGKKRGPYRNASKATLETVEQVADWVELNGFLPTAPVKRRSKLSKINGMNVSQFNKAWKAIHYWRKKEAEGTLLPQVKCAIRERIPGALHSLPSFEGKWIEVLQKNISSHSNFKRFPDLTFLSRKFPNFSKANYLSVEHYVLSRLKFPVSPSMCNVDQGPEIKPTIYRMLCFICQPRYKAAYLKGCPKCWKIESPLQDSIFISKKMLEKANQKGLLKLMLEAKAKVYSKELRSHLGNKSLSKEEMSDMSQFFEELDNGHFSQHGHVLRRKRDRNGNKVGYESKVRAINLATFGQPRRSTFSIKINLPWVEGVNEVRTLFSYHSAYRPISDWRCRVMPGFLYELGEAVWRTCFHYLSPVSQCTPPNVCQVQIYTGTLDNKVENHRDMAHSISPVCENGNNCQILGSSVVIVSFFDSMDFEFLTEEEKVVHLVHLFKTGDCSIHVLGPRDDRKYKHRAAFDKTGESCKGMYRFCLTFRWVYVTAPYFSNTPFQNMAHARYDKDDWDSMVGPWKDALGPRPF